MEKNNKNWKECYDLMKGCMESLAKAEVMEHWDEEIHSDFCVALASAISDNVEEEEQRGVFKQLMREFVALLWEGIGSPNICPEGVAAEAVALTPDEWNCITVMKAFLWAEEEAEKMTALGEKYQCTKFAA